MRRGQALLPNCAVTPRNQLGLPVSICSEELCAERLLPNSAVTDEPVSLIPVLQAMIARSHQTDFEAHGTRRHPVVGCAMDGWTWSRDCRAGSTPVHGLGLRRTDGRVADL